MVTSSFTLSKASVGIHQDVLVSIGCTCLRYLFVMIKNITRAGGVSAEKKNSFCTVHSYSLVLIGIDWFNSSIGIVNED